MNIIQTKIPGCLIIEPQVFGDARGCFVELHHQRKLKDAGIDATFVQDNFSRSKKNTLRGLHYQIKHPQGKLIWVVRGEIVDVVVDLRANSPTFGQSEQVKLSEDNFRQFYVPPGLAHGFCVVSDVADVFYKCTDFYAPEHERTLLWNDPELKINWPTDDPILSDKDKVGLPLEQADKFE